jgi:hypothetical protein
MIKTIGRKDLELGPLCNLTDGGEGSSGYKHTSESLEKMKINSSRTWDEIYGEEESTRRKHELSEKMSGDKNTFYNKKHSQETCNVLSELASKRTGDKNSFYNKHHKPETLQLMSKKLRSPEISLQLSECKRKYTDEQIKEVLQLKSEGKKYKEISIITGINKNTIMTWFNTSLKYIERIKEEINNGLV